MLTKSGTNEFHGSGFALHEDQGLRARNFFNSGPRDSAAFKSHRNIDGATFGGPIVKNKLFFFGGWEGTYEKTANTRTDTVPTGAMRAGNFSSFGTTIYDPATGRDVNGTWTRQPFAGNIIPSNRLNPIAKNIIAFFPNSFAPKAATSPAAPSNGFANRSLF